MRRFLSQFIPFIFIGIALVSLAFGIMILAYLFFLGAIVGLVLFGVTWFKNKFFPPATLPKTKKNQSGRVIDSDDWRKM